VKNKPVKPQDLGATIYHALNVALDVRLAQDGIFKPITTALRCSTYSANRVFRSAFARRNALDATGCRTHFGGKFRILALLVAAGLGRLCDATLRYAPG
jgi:hypothetical protein